MKSFRQFILLSEDRAQKTLDWIKSRPENVIHKKIDLITHDFSMAEELKDHDNNKTPLHHAVIDKISELDPTKNKSLTQTLHDWWKKGQFKHEDSPRIQQAIGTFFDKRKELGNTQHNGKIGSDFTSYNSIHELENHLDKHFGEKNDDSSNNSFHHPDAPLVFHDHDNDVKIWELKTKQASKATRCFPGTRNRWCTAIPENEEEAKLAWEKYNPRYHKPGSNAFDSYPHGLHMIQVGNEPPLQFHVASDQFMNSGDEPIKNKDFASLLEKSPKLKGFKPLHPMVARFMPHEIDKLIDGVDPEYYPELHRK